MSTAAARSRNTSTERSVLSQLLHGLNQPLTGLQCAMEVALAAPRTVEQYREGLRQGLELTERMRALVEALREVADFYDELPAASGIAEHPKISELMDLLPGAVDEMRPLAEANHVRIVLALSDSALSLNVVKHKSHVDRVIFRLLDSTLSMATRGTELHIAIGGDVGVGWLRMQWQAKEVRAALSRPELGLLIAQAWLEQVGCVWERESTDEAETLTVRLPRVS
jgi:signal transduction histidine kinase